MSNYSQNVTFTPKDALTPGDPAKRIKGTEMDAELGEISTAIASKEDTANKGQNNGYAGLGAGGLVDPSDLPTATDTAQGAVELATDAEAVTGTATNRAVTPANVEAWANQNGGMVKDISDLSDPNADRILFWDDSAGAVALLTPSGITITTTSIAVDAASETASGIVELATTAEAVTGTDTARAVTPAGLEAWAAQNASMVQDIANLSDPNADRLLGWDDSAAAAIGFALVSPLEASTTNIVLDMSNLASSLTGQTIAGPDLIMIDDGAGGTNKKMAYQDSGVPIITTSAAATPTSATVNSCYVLTGSTNRAFTLNTSVGIAGNWFILTCTGTGLWTFGGTATKVSAVGTTNLAAQYSVCIFLCTSANNWVIFGDAV